MSPKQPEDYKAVIEARGRYTRGAMTPAFCDAPDGGTGMARQAHDCQPAWELRARQRP